MIGRSLAPVPRPRACPRPLTRREQAVSPQLGERVRRQRRTEIVALCLVAAVAAQKVELFIGFDAFGGHRETEDLTEPDHGLGDGSVIGIGDDVAHE